MNDISHFNPERRRIFIGGALLVLLVVLLILAFMPEKKLVDTAVIERGDMMVTVKEEGKTRVKDIFTVSAPLSGRVLRIESEVGDSVYAYKTILARIEPSEPNFLNVRTRAEAESALKAAEAAKVLAEADVARVQAELDYANSEMIRSRELAKKGNISQSALDRAVLELKTKKAALQTAQAALRVKQYELERAKASLIDPGQVKTGDMQKEESCCIPIYAPVNGRILKIMDTSTRVVAAGEPLIEVGDPRALEIVVELLSTDAVKVKEGSAAFIENWGQPHRLHGIVRRVEPFGFTKISALGIEEQRVNVVIDLTDPPDEWRALGHGYRVEAEIVTWTGSNVLKIPLSALFRKGNQWAAFLAEKGRAHEVTVKINHINSNEAEIISGLKEKELVIVHPSDQISDGVRIQLRQEI